MINISFNNISNGPGKVVTNLILGLEKSGIEYKTNQQLQSEDKLLVLQYTHMLTHGTNEQKMVSYINLYYKKIFI